MKNEKLIFLTGSNGIIGKKIKNILRDQGYNFYTISGGKIYEDICKKRNINLNDYFKFLDYDLKKLSQSYNNAYMILSHRTRCNNVIDSLECEYILSKELVVYIGKFFKNMNVTYIGSITGGLVDIKSPESYHYTKDLQKSINRYLTINFPSIKSNILEISAFKKYCIEESSENYKIICEKYTKVLGELYLLSLDDIANEVIYFTTNNMNIRGAIIPLDSGYSIIQK